jgi:hypothetical protein
MDDQDDHAVRDQKPPSSGDGGGDADAGDPRQLAVLAGRLAALRRAAPPAPPAGLEPALLAAFRRRTGAGRGRGFSGRRLAAAALFGLGAAAGVWFARSRAPDPTRTVVLQPPGPAGPGSARPTLTGPTPAPSPARGGFRPLGLLEAHRPLEAGRVARVELTGEIAAYFGWPLVPDLPRARVQADVLYGEDGSARALRFLPATFRSAPIPEEKP